MIPSDQLNEMETEMETLTQMFQEELGEEAPASVLAIRDRFRETLRLTRKSLEAQENLAAAKQSNLAPQALDSMRLDVIESRLDTIEAWIRELLTKIPNPRD